LGALRSLLDLVVRAFGLSPGFLNVVSPGARSVPGGSTIAVRVPGRRSQD